MSFNHTIFRMEQKLVFYIYRIITVYVFYIVTLEPLLMSTSCVSFLFNC